MLNGNSHAQQRVRTARVLFSVAHMHRQQHQQHAANMWFSNKDRARITSCTHGLERARARLRSNVRYIWQCRRLPWPQCAIARVRGRKCCASGPPVERNTFTRQLSIATCWQTLKADAEFTLQCHASPLPQRPPHCRCWATDSSAGTRRIRCRRRHDATAVWRANVRASGSGARR